MNAKEIFVQAAKILYNDYVLYNNEKKNKENNNTNKKLINQPETPKKNKCC